MLSASVRRCDRLGRREGMDVKSAHVWSGVLASLIVGCLAFAAEESDGKAAEFISPEPTPPTHEILPVPVSTRAVPVQAIQTADAKPASVAAPAQTKGYHLSLEAAIEIAILNNLGLRISRLRDRSTDVDLRSAWADYYPTFNGSFLHSHSGASGQGTNQISGGVTQRSPWGTVLDFAITDSRNGFDPNSATGNIGFDVRQPLWKGAGPEVGLANIRSARIARLISRATLDLDAQQLILNVRQTYNNIVSQIQNMVVSRQQVRSQQIFLELTQSREQAGQVTKLDVFNADVQLHQRELDLLRNETALENALDSLKQLMDVDLAEKLIVDAPIIDFGDKYDTNLVAAAPELKSDEELGTVSLTTVARDGQKQSTLLFQATRFDEASILKEALDNRIDLLNQRRLMAQQKLAALVAKNGLGMQVDMVGSFGHNTTHSIFEGGGNGKDNNDWTVGLNTSIPWGKIRDRASFEKALLNLQQTEISLKAVRTSVEADVRDNMRLLRQLEKSLLVQGRIVEASKRSAEAAQISFDRGLKDSFDVITAQNNLLASKRDFIGSLVGYANSIAQLEKTVGKPTGRVDVAAGSIGGLIDARTPDEIRDRGLPKPAPEPEPRPDDDPLSSLRGYRKDYAPQRPNPLNVEVKK